MSITITIDNKEIKTDIGATLIDVAADNGIFIPRLCYMRGKPCLGTCRVCSVKVNGWMAASCTIPVQDGMIVEVDTSEVKDIQKALVETLFSEGTHNCPSCEKSGRCDLQAMGYETDMMVSRFPYRFTERNKENAANLIWLERDRCIFCQRCVNFIQDEETGQKIFSISGRGPSSRIEIDKELADKMNKKQARAASDICPVGCIIDKERGYDHAMGVRKYDITSIRERILKGEQ
ncbi:MAG: 2Fe-2S iron-sulfur cluster binding domain-containing protein [Sulfurovum sp.]|nr:2Fe-2S iron-sulfur cluster binding domain-containing protein [Sulfurovum sp.]